MPENRCVVIDSKVSYVNYNEYQNAEDPSVAKDYLGMLTKDVKNHINGLAKKSYSDSIDNTMDFVMMFIPIEPALMAVLAYDQTLWEHAYKKRVLLIGPSNLISALKIVENLWVKEKQNLNTQAVMNRATQLIGKFDVVMDKLAQLGSHLNTAATKYNETVVSFVDGNGSLKRQIEMMEELGASKEKGKTKRATPVLIENPTSISGGEKDM
jgi:DNA recombination protein RmuC